MVRSTPCATLEEEKEDEQTKKDGVDVPAAASATATVHPPVALPMSAAPEVGFTPQPAPLFPAQQQQQQWQQARVLPQLLPSQVMAGVNMGGNVEQWPQALPLQLHYICSWTSPPPPPLPPPLPPPQRQQGQLPPLQWQPSMTSSSPSSAAQYSQPADGQCAMPSGIQMKTLDNAAERQQQQEQEQQEQQQQQQQPPPSYIVWSLVTFLFCSTPLGAAALIASVLVQQEANFAGSTRVARRASLMARRLNATAAVLGPIIWVAFTVFAMRWFVHRSRGGFA